MRQLRFLQQVIEHFTSRHHHPAPQSTLAHLARSRQQSQPDLALLAEQTSRKQPSASPYLPLSLPVSGSATLFPSSPTNPVTIQDSTGNAGPLFYLNSQYNPIVVKVLVQSALGLSDFQTVNVTIFDPHGDPVKKATDEPMQGPQTG